MTRPERIQKAASYLGAVKMGNGKYAYFADETSSWWVVSASKLVELTGLLEDQDEQIQKDAYGHWCASGGAEEKPRGWSP